MANRSRNSKQSAKRDALCASRSRRLSIETLEPRLLLDGNGFITGNDVYLTLSFAPDGTDIANESNSIAARFDTIAPTADWQDAILRAFQTWAVETNADIGIVSDNGDPFGSPGPSQNDIRFGEIRIGAIAMTPSVGAVSVPVDGLVTGTWFADVVFNTAFNYTTLDDIYAVALHEAGNVFGLEDNSDTNSPLYIGGAPTGLPPTANDLAALHQLHGLRFPDFNESEEDGPTNNDSFSNATDLDLVEFGLGDDGSAPSIVYGDITDNLDRDFFELETPEDYTGPLTIQVRSTGISLLSPTVKVYDDNQQLVAQATATSTRGDWLTLSLPSVVSDEDYYIEIAGAAPGLYGIGGYSLVATLDGVNQVSQEEIDAIAGGQFRFLEQEEISKFFDTDEDDLFGDDLHTDDTPLTAAGLQTTPGFANAAQYEIIASISNSTDIDYYSLRSPALLPVPLDVMTVLVRSLDDGGLIPSVTVLDINGLPVPSTILANGGGEYIIQVDGVILDSDYQIKVEAADNLGPFNSGNYRLTVTFGSQATQLAPLSTGTVGNGITQNIHSLYIGQPQLLHIALQIDPAATTSPTAVVATIKNDLGEIVYQIAAAPGETRSREAVLLDAGSYTVEITPFTLDGSTPPAISYSLLGTSISDLFVGDPDDPTNNPFACSEPGLEGLFCYPGGFITPDPFLWDSFVDSLTNPPEIPNLPDLVTFLFGDWWTWVWNQTGTNGPPFSQPDAIQIPEVSAAIAPLILGPTGSVLDNDIDPENDALIAILQSEPTNGSLSIANDGTFIYTPNLGFSGRDEFTYTAFDFSQESASTTVSIIVGESGNFDADSEVDGADFLTWQRSAGTLSGAVLTSGDSDFDGDVDSLDLANWQQQFGATSILPPSNGDADADADVDGLDFLAWQRGSGISLGATAQDGDADADGDVDAQDLLAWKNNFGSPAALAASTASGESSAPAALALVSKPVSNTISTATTAAKVPTTTQATPTQQPTAETNKLLATSFVESPYSKAFATAPPRVGQDLVSENARHSAFFMGDPGYENELLEIARIASSSRNEPDLPGADIRDRLFAEFHGSRFEQIRSAMVDAFSQFADELELG